MNNDEKFGCLKMDQIQVDLDEMSDDELAKIEEEIVKLKTNLRRKIDENLEIIEIMANNTENVSDETTEEIIQKIIEKQYQHSIVKAVRNIKRSRDLINARQMQLEKFINEQSKKYGQSASILEKDIEEYKNMLEQVNNELNKIKKVIMKQKEEILNIEYDKIVLLSKKRDERKALKKSDEYKEYRTQINNLNRDLNKEMENDAPSDAEIKRISNQIEQLEQQDKLVFCENDIQELRKDIIEARKLSIEIDKQLEQYIASLKDYIEKASKDEDITIVENSNKKYGAIKKIFAHLFNKIGGANKYQEVVVNNIKKKVDRMKTIYLPEVLSKMQEDGIEEIYEIIGKKQNIQKIQQQSDDIKLMAKQQIESMDEMFKIIIDAGNNKREQLMKIEV